MTPDQVTAVWTPPAVLRDKLSASKRIEIAQNAAYQTEELCDRALGVLADDEESGDSPILRALVARIRVLALHSYTLLSADNAASREEYEAAAEGVRHG